MRSLLGPEVLRCLILCHRLPRHHCARSWLLGVNCSIAIVADRGAIHHVILAPWVWGQGSGSQPQGAPLRITPTNLGTIGLSRAKRWVKERVRTRASIQGSPTWWWCLSSPTMVCKAATWVCGVFPVAQLPNASSGCDHQEWDPQASSPPQMYDVATCMQRSQAKPQAFRQIAYTKRPLTEEERQQERENQEALRLASLEIKDRRPSLLSLHFTKARLHE